MNSASKQVCRPVIKGTSCFLAHVPGLVRHGSKPSREIVTSRSVLPQILSHLRSFIQAVGYAPNQVFIGNMDPDNLTGVPLPWTEHPVAAASRYGEFGEIMPEEEFYGLMKMCDQFDIIMLEEGFLAEVTGRLRSHRLLNTDDLPKLGKGFPADQIRQKLAVQGTLPLYAEGNRLIGCCQRPSGGGAEEDDNLSPHILLENLAAKATGTMALRHLIANAGLQATGIDYLMGFGEEAIGDRYNRGGGNLAKSIGEVCGCVNATGSDVKAFCCAPVHSMVLASGLVASNIFSNVVMVAGGSLAKLGMKFQGHVRHNMPILEDVLAGIAVWIARDDDVSPVVRLDCVGKHTIGSGSSQQAIIEKLVVEPLDRLGMKLTDVDKYATEMHNPEITEPQGSGNVPRTNYRTIGSFAVLRGEIAREDLDHFVDVHGMPGFSPTQGHIASAIPYLGHAVRNIKTGKIANAMLLAKGSLFLGRMTQLSDGVSVLISKNSGGNG